eukprot:Ihof_evm2s344 gene=Ihof_evmTU2s344
MSSDSDDVSILDVLDDCRDACNKFPVGECVGLYKQNVGYQGVMKQQRKSILTRLLMLVNQVQSGEPITLDLDPDLSDNEDGLEDTFERLQDVIDSRLTLVDRLCDNMSVLGNQESEPEVEEEIVADTLTVTKNDKDMTLYYLKNTAHPQLSFDPKPDNTHRLYEPCLTVKPNAIAPLVIAPQQTSMVQTEPVHPYLVELQQFTPKDWMMAGSQRTKDQSELFVNSDFIWISQSKPLLVLEDMLSREKEISISILDHKFRSYLGLSCIVVLTTRTACYAVDGLALRKQMVALNSVFTNPDIVKVMYNSSETLGWLQRDFNLFVVNLLDIALAEEITEGGSIGFSPMAKTHLAINLDEEQFVDWRMRPMSTTVLSNAVSRAQCLLPLADVIRTRISLEQLNDVWARGTALCKVLYRKTDLPHIERTLIGQLGDNVDPRQVRAVKLLCEWRDNLARDEDESIWYVMPDAMLLEVACKLPKDPTSLLSCYPLTPPLVKVYALEIIQLLKQIEEGVANHQPRWKAIVALKEEIIKQSSSAKGIKRRKSSDDDIDNKTVDKSQSKRKTTRSESPDIVKPKTKKQKKNKEEKLSRPTSPCTPTTLIEKDDGPEGDGEEDVGQKELTKAEKKRAKRKRTKERKRREGQAGDASVEATSVDNSENDNDSNNDIILDGTTVEKSILIDDCVKGERSDNNSDSSVNTTKITMIMNELENKEVPRWEDDESDTDGVMVRFKPTLSSDSDIEIVKEKSTKGGTGRRKKNKVKGKEGGSTKKLSRQSST